MADPTAPIIHRLLQKGVTIPCPAGVEIGEEVNPDRISGDGVVIHAGSRIFGKHTLILKGAVIGGEAPATVRDCHVGPFVRLGGGSFHGAVFLKNASAGPGSHFREGVILEEEASAAHTVGLKQTILFPFVTLGSLINFCDCLMAGGTGKKHHSEVGSSYIHFNFTPQQDKATASLLGDVPNGVMLNQPPIFLGGQGGLVGPCRLGFGVTVAAGAICRKDETRPHRLIFGGGPVSGNIAYSPGTYSNARRVFENNILYLANLLALMQWYQTVRWLFISDDFPLELHQGLTAALDLAVSERLRRLGEFVEKLALEPGKHEAEGRYRRKLIQGWPETRGYLETCRATAVGEESLSKPFTDAVQAGIGGCGPDYIRVIQTLAPDDVALGVRWLQGIVDKVTQTVMG